MSSKLHKIAVPDGIVGHGRTYQEVVLREPTFREYLDIGDPWELISYSNGMQIPTVNAETMSRYIEILLVEPKDALVVEQGGMALAKKMKNTILGFFQPDKSADDDLKMSGKNSSGEPTSSQPAT